MNKPIIDPSTLSEEQRDAIRAKYTELDSRWWDAPTAEESDYAYSQLSLMEEIFGWDFFKKGE